MSELSRSRASFLAATLLVAAGLSSCRAPEAVEPAAPAAGEVPERWEEPILRLRELLKIAAHGAMGAGEEMELEALIAREVAPPFEGLAWRATRVALPAGSFVALELVGDGAPADRRLWGQLVVDPEAPLGDGVATDPIGGRHEVREAPGHHLVVRAGTVEILLVAESEALREPGRLGALAAGFPLDEISRAFASGAASSPSPS